MVFPARQLSDDKCDWTKDALRTLLEHSLIAKDTTNFDRVSGYKRGLSNFVLNLSSSLAATES